MLAVLEESAKRESEKNETEGARVMSIAKFLRNVWNDERGGEVLEYALIVGLIVVAAIAAITSVGTKVLARWTSLNASV